MAVVERVVAGIVAMGQPFGVADERRACADHRHDVLRLWNQRIQRRGTGDAFGILDLHFNASEHGGLCAAGFRVILRIGEAVGAAVTGRAVAQVVGRREDRRGTQRR